MLLAAAVVLGRGAARALILLWPLPAALVLTVILGAYALVFGAVLLALALRLRRHTHATAAGATTRDAAPQQLPANGLPEGAGELLAPPRDLPAPHDRWPADEHG